MRIFIADDQTEIRSALRLLLEAKLGLEVVGEAEEAAIMFARVKREHPDLVLLDWELPGLDPNTLRAGLPHAEFIALSCRPEAEKEALASGARAFLSKGEAPYRLVAALKDVKHKTKGEREE